MMRLRTILLVGLSPNYSVQRLGVQPLDSTFDALPSSDDAL